MRKLILLSLLALTASVSTAETITTLFADNNSGGVGGGVYFDVTVGALPLEIKSFEVNSSAIAGTAIRFEVWTRPGTASGFQNSMDGWTSQATGTGTTAGRGLPSAINLDNTFVMDPGLSGMAITLGTVGHAYTNGNGQNQHYENNNLALDLGSANNAIFGAGLFSPRVWNGSITYNVVPEPSTLALLAIVALALTRRFRLPMRQPIRSAMFALAT